MKVWNFIKTPEFWITIVLVPLISGLIVNYFSKKPTAVEETENNGGDIIIKAGDGGPHGNGGNVNIGPGTYKAGDVIQKK
ncbi:MAG: hypothetical protein Q8Q94_00805 [bacterium]|nr:hypothetical protein [bacterium]